MSTFADSSTAEDKTNIKTSILKKKYFNVMNLSQDGKGRGGGRVTGLKEPLSQRGR